MITVILDNGHGNDTDGKRSPVWKDGTQLFEYEFNRDIVRRTANRLQEKGLPFEVLIPEVWDVSLPERCRRANRIYDRLKGKAILISVHANAGGGTGWECYTSKGETEADVVATYLCEQAEGDFPGWKMRFDWCDGDPDKESQFYILKHTKCPAVLTENFFMDTERPDCRFIISEEGRERIAEMHVRAIERYIRAKENG